jgi:AraC-like DNA-binding protein
VLSTRLGLSFFDYINGLRVEAVKATLARPQSVGRPLLEIALECGFGSKSAFNEAFKRATGMSPSMYRRSLPASAVALQVLERDAPAALRGVPVQQST